jgi:hypothetical protein
MAQLEKTRNRLRIDDKQRLTNAMLKSSKNTFLNLDVWVLCEHEDQGHVFGNLWHLHLPDGVDRRTMSFTY